MCCFFFFFPPALYDTWLTFHRYPKPGTPNPTVTVHTFSLSSLSSPNVHRLTWPGEFPLPDRIITEVGWVADDALLVKEIDRAARDGNVVLFQFESEEGKSKTMEGKIVRRLGKDGEEGDDGWIDHASVVPFSPPPRELTTYLIAFLYIDRAKTSSPSKDQSRDTSTSCLTKGTTTLRCSLR